MDEAVDFQTNSKLRAIRSTRGLAIRSDKRAAVFTRTVPRYWTN